MQVKLLEVFKLRFMVFCGYKAQWNAGYGPCRCETASGIAPRFVALSPRTLDLVGAFSVQVYPTADMTSTTLRQCAAAVLKHTTTS